jgi:hypothetical protein
MSTITVTTFKWVPPIVQGLVRDLRVRWALMLGNGDLNPIDFGRGHPMRGTQ